MGYWGFSYSQPTIAELKAKAEKTIEREAQKGHILHPIILEGRTIAKSWWGNAWCRNLESYADFASRIERGRRYVRANCVIDLVIDKGVVTALVQGSHAKPYSVEIDINPLPKKTLKAILENPLSKLSNLEELVSGRFPEEMEELFRAKGKGLFPSPKEISMSCSCPDWAVMCKHVAAVLYAIGAKFDEDPLLFFKLRGIDTADFIQMTVEKRLNRMLGNADKLSSRVMDAETDLAEIFGEL